MRTDKERVKPWKVLESEYLIRRPWLTARKDKVELPSGAVYDEYYVLEYPAWVNIIAITDDGRYVMVEQYRHALGIVETELCAGVVEEGEKPIDGARRELKEETGYAGGRWSLNCITAGNPGSANNLCYCFIARGVKKVSGQHLDDTEDIKVRILTERQLFSLLRKGEIKQAMMTTSLWKYFYNEISKKILAHDTDGSDSTLRH